MSMCIVCVGWGVRVYVHVTAVPTEVRREHWIPWNWRYRHHMGAGN